MFYNALFDHIPYQSENHVIFTALPGISANLVSLVCQLCRLLAAKQLLSAKFVYIIHFPARMCKTILGLLDNIW